MSSRRRLRNTYSMAVAAREIGEDVAWKLGERLSSESVL